MMNFMGHAFVALAHSRAPMFVLGSMLPDFASMAATRLSAVQHPELRAGVALHHRTDDVFHGAPSFVSLMSESMRTLCEQGVPRGPARAVGHIGVEMLIDGELLARPSELAATYLDALSAFGAGEDVQLTLPPLRLLSERLARHGVPYDYREPEAVLRRLRFMLQGRPRLALDEAASAVCEKFLPVLQKRVREALPALLDELDEQLSAGLSGTEAGSACAKTRARDADTSALFEYPAPSTPRSAG